MALGRAMGMRMDLAGCAVAATLLGSCLRPAAPATTGQSVDAERPSCASADRLCLVFRNEMTRDFEVARLLVVLDGAVVFNREGTLSVGDHVIHSGPASPGDHVVQVLLQMTHEGYHFEARSSHTMKVAASAPRADTLVTVAYELPRPRLEERPAVRYLEEPANFAQRAATIWVSKNGDIELDGKPSDVEAVRRSLDDLAVRGGVVVYGVDASQSESHPNAKKVIELMARPGLSIRLSVARDFSDVVGPSGAIKDPPAAADGGS